MYNSYFSVLNIVQQCNFWSPLGRVTTIAFDSGDLNQFMT